jgi:hypothetical protein
LCRTGCDDEPSLGSLDNRMSQLRWGQPDRHMWWPNTDLESLTKQSMKSASRTSRTTLRKVVKRGTRQRHIVN